MRTVVSIDPFGERDPATGLQGMVVKVERSPFVVAAASVVRPFELKDQPDWGTPNAVKLRGQLLRDALRSHKGIGMVLDSLALAGAGQLQPIFVKLAQGEAELITWEALCDVNDKFVALDKRWPIGRIADPMYSPSRPPTVLRQTFKVLAVISAFGIKGQAKEWQFFENAVRQARANGLDVTLRLLIADDATRKSIDARIAAGDNWIEVSHVEKTGARVISDIIGWDPSMVHFFCHGIAVDGGQSLELATASDYGNAAATSGSVTITAEQLSDMSGQLTNPWLLTLNCCSGGEAVDDLQSMAFQCVSAGFPASVAMVEPVDASDAHEFTRAFYSSLFVELRRVANDLRNASSAPFEWAQIMHEARQAIVAQHQNDADNARQWALPALYVRGVDPMKIERPADVSPEQAAQYKQQVKLVAEFLQSQYELPEGMRREAIAAALADVPKRFWPAPDGSFTPTGP